MLDATLHRVSTGREGDPTVPHAGDGAQHCDATGRYQAVRALCGFLVLCCAALSGCTNVVDGDPTAKKSGPGSGGPIFASQIDDLLTPSGAFSVVNGSPLTETDMQSALFVAADPTECHGVVAFGRYPLFPSNYTGREARTQQDYLADQHQLLEVSATYPTAFDAGGFLDSVRKTVSGCQRPVTARGDDGHQVEVNPGPLIPGPSEVAHWMTHLPGQKWICEFAMIAKANVVSEIVTCSPDRSPDMETLITKRLKKINELLKSTS